MSLSPSFSDLPFHSGPDSGFTADSRVASHRRSAEPMNPVPVIPASAPLSEEGVRSRDRFPRGQGQPPVDRRDPNAATRRARAGVERRQFGSSHAELSNEGRELATAIDHYKMHHHRRYITCDEMLVVLDSLGYQRPSDRSQSEQD